MVVGRLPHRVRQMVYAPASSGPARLRGVVGASPGAGYVNGQVIVVDGGNAVAEERALSR